MIRVLFYILENTMKIKKYILPLFFSIYSLQTFAAPATDHQVETLIKIENWNKLKPALAANGLPNLKSATKDALIEQFGLAKPISAQNQEKFTEITDIVMNDLINQIDEKELINNVKHMYKQLSQEQVNAIIELYQKPSMKDAGKKFPQSLAYTIDISSNDFNQLIQSKEVQAFVKETQ
jgi:hypothetical protein